MSNQPNFVYTHLSGVSSSAISTLGYNENTKRMFVRFKQGNEVVYNDVPLAEFESFLAAQSIGQYYAYNIKGTYTGTSQTNTRLRKSEATAKPVKKQAGPAGPTTTVSVAGAGKTSRFSIAWENKDGKIGGHPEFHATDENDALAQFQAALESAAKAGFAPAKSAVKVRAITRYFD